MTLFNVLAQKNCQAVLTRSVYAHDISAFAPVGAVRHDHPPHVPLPPSHQTRPENQRLSRGPPTACLSGYLGPRAAAGGPATAHRAAVCCCQRHRCHLPFNVSTSLNLCAIVSRENFFRQTKLEYQLLTETLKKKNTRK